jgi:hypothetical protein
MFALCCAAPPGSTTVEIPPEAGNSAEALRSSDAKGMMSKVTVERSSNGARFDRFQQSDLVTPSWGGSEQPPGADVPAFGRQLSTSSYGSNLDGKSKEERLQELLREFRPMLAEGIRLSMVEVDTRLFSQCLFTLDMNSSTMHIVPAFGDQQAFDLKDITAIFKGQEFARKASLLCCAHLGPAAGGHEHPGHRPGVQQRAWLSRSTNNSPLPGHDREERLLRLPQDSTNDVGGGRPSCCWSEVEASCPVGESCKRTAALEVDRLSFLQLVGRGFRLRVFALAAQPFLAL